MEDSESEYEEEEAVILVELNGIIDTNFLLEKPEPIKILGIETERPIFQLGHYIFAGEYEDTMGTLVTFKPKENNNEKGKEEKDYEFFCKTDKKLTMKRIFLQEKVTDDIETSELSSEALNNLASSENGDISVENSKRVVDNGPELIDNTFQPAISSIDLPVLEDQHATDTMEFCLESLLSNAENALKGNSTNGNICQNASDFPKRLLNKQKASKSKAATSRKNDSNNKTETSDITAPSYSNNSQVKINSPIDSISHNLSSSPPSTMRNLKRKRSVDDDESVRSSNKEVKIAHDVVLNIIENVSDERNKKNNELNTEHTNIIPLEAEAAVSQNNILTNSSESNDIEPDLTVFGEPNTPASVSNVESPALERLNIQSDKVGNSFPESNEAMQSFVSSALEENSGDDEEEQGDVPTRNALASVETTSDTYSKYQAVESSTDKAISPASQQEWEPSEEDKCSSSGDMQLISNNSSEISQSTDPSVNAISIASSSTRESSEYEISHSIEVQSEETTNEVCEVSQSSKKILTCQFVEPSENERNASDCISENEPTETQQQNILSSDSISDPCMSSDDVEVQHNQESTSYAFETETNAGSSHCEVSQSRDSGENHTDLQQQTILSSESSGDPCRSSDDIDVLPHQESESYAIAAETNAGSSQCEVSQSKNGENDHADVQQPTILSSEFTRDPCMSSDDIEVVHSQRSPRYAIADETNAGSSQCEVSQSKNGGNSRVDLQQQNILSSESTADPCMSSDDIEVLHQESTSYATEDETNAGSSQCEVSQSKNSGNNHVALQQQNILSSESTGDPCMSSDDIEVLHQESTSYSIQDEANAGSSQCEVSQSKNGESGSTDLMGSTSRDSNECDACGQSDDPSYNAPSPSLIERIKDLCASSDDVVTADNSESSTVEQGVKNPNWEVSQSSKSVNLRNERCDGNDQYDLKGTSECEVYGQSSDNIYEPSVSGINVGQKDPCVSSDDVNESYEVTNTNRVRNSCEVTQSTKFEDYTSMTVDHQEVFEVDSINSDDYEDVESKGTIYEVTQSSKSGTEQVEVFECVDEDEESSNEGNGSRSKNSVCEVTQSSKFEEETFIIVDEDESLEAVDDDSVEYEGEVTQSSKSGEIQQESLNDEQCSSECGGSSKNFVCEVTQSIESGNEVFDGPNTQGHVEDDINREEYRSKNLACEVTQSSKSNKIIVVHDVQDETAEDGENSNECEVSDQVHDGSTIPDNSSRDSVEDPCESSDDVRMLLTAPNKTSRESVGEGECSSSSKNALNNSGNDEQFYNADSLPKLNTLGMFDNEARTSKDQENSFVEASSFHCESSTTSASMVNVSSSSSSVNTSAQVSSQTIYSASGVVSDSSDIIHVTSPETEENLSPVHIRSLDIKIPVDEMDHLIDSSSSSSSIEVINYDFPSESTQAVNVAGANNSLTNEQVSGSPVGSSVVQCTESTNMEQDSSYIGEESDDSNDVIEVVQSSTSSKPSETYRDQAESSGFKSEVQFVDEEVEVLSSEEGSPNKDKCSSSYSDSICTSNKMTDMLNSSEASCSKQEDRYAPLEKSSDENEIVCDSKVSDSESEDKCIIIENSSNEAASSHHEMQESVSENRPSLLEVIVSSASDFRNSLIHESSGFVRNEARSLLVSEVTESSLSKTEGVSSEFPESLTNEAVGFSREMNEHAGSQSHNFFIDVDNTGNSDNNDTEVTESSDSKMDISSHIHKDGSSQHQVSQSSEIVNTDSSSSRNRFSISSEIVEENLQRDFVQSSTSISHVSTMSLSNDSYGSTEQVTSAEENMPSGQFYEPLPHEVPGSSSNEIGTLHSGSRPLSMESDLLSHSDVIQSTSQNPTLFEANLSLYQKIETVDTEVSSSPCHEQAQSHGMEDNDQMSEVEVIEMQSPEIRESLSSSQNIESEEVVASTVNNELISSPSLSSAAMEVGESSSCEVTASHLDKSISSCRVYDSTIKVKGDFPPCEVSESLSYQFDSSTVQRSHTVDGSSPCNVIGSTTGAKRFEYDSSSSSSSVVEVEYDGESKSSVNEADVLSPELVIETNDSESMNNEEVEPTDLYICESSKSSENNSKNSSICEVTESCAAEQNESSDSFTNDSKVSSYSVSESTSVQRPDASYHENEFSALSSHEAIARSYEVFPSEGPSEHDDQHSNAEAVSQSTPAAVELSMYEHVADFESDSVQSSSFEATQFSVNEQIKAISSPPQFSDSSSDNDQPQINTNPFISPDGEYMPSENCNLPDLGSMPSHSSNISYSVPFQVCPFPSLMSSSEGTSLYKVDQVPSLSTGSLPPFDIRTAVAPNFANIVSEAATSDNLICPTENIAGHSANEGSQFMEVPQGIYELVDVPESLPMEISHVAYGNLVHSSEDIRDAAETDDNASHSEDFKMPSSTSN